MTLRAISKRIHSEKITPEQIKIILGYGNIYKRKNVYTLNFSTKNNIIDFYHFLYDNSNIYLDRKKETFDKIMYI